MNKKQKVLFAYNVLQFCYFTYKYLESRRVKRRWWVRPVNKKRSKLGFYETTFKRIEDNDHEQFFKYTRMNRKQYDLLLILVEDRLKKSSIRKPISPECRLVLTLVYLSQGVSRNYLAWRFRMGISTAREIIIEVCDILWEILSKIYMEPLNSLDWVQISNDFETKWQMPNCVGSIDGKHVEIKCPPKFGSQCYSYKGHFSIVLMGVCDANCVFTAVDVGVYDGTFGQSAFSQTVLNSDINIPLAKPLPNSNQVTPLYFVADNTFPLRKNLMRPYPGLLLEHKKENFNRRLSRGRGAIENAFGILSARWRILATPIEFQPKNAEKAVLACAVLHNFLKITDDAYNNQTYSPQNYVDNFDRDGNLIPGLWREENVHLQSVSNLCTSNNSTREALALRETLANYFIDEGMTEIKT